MELNKVKIQICEGDQDSLQMEDPLLHQNRWIPAQLWLCEENVDDDETKIRSKLVHYGEGRACDDEGSYGIRHGQSIRRIVFDRPAGLDFGHIVCLFNQQTFP